MSTLSCPQLIDCQRYPLDQQDSPQLARTIADVQAALAQDGCAVLPGFLSEHGLDALIQEARSRVDKVYYSPQQRCNVYFDDGDPDLADSHPRNRFLNRTNGFITSDCYGDETHSRQLYGWQPLAAFLASCLGREELFIYDDPVSNMIVNVAREGQEFNWHFDTNEFTITLLLQGAESGGEFEYVPGLRSASDECYGAVAKVLDGDRSQVKTLQLRPGDLQFFLGRYSLHRVSPCQGPTPRLLQIMSFTEVPGVIGSRRRVQTLYGKTTEAHLAAEKNRIRADGLLD